MILYSPIDGEALTSKVVAQPRHCFLMTRLGKPIPQQVAEIGVAVKAVCNQHNYKVIDAGSQVTGRDFLMKIWKMIASSPLAVAVCHEDIAIETQGNIFYELGLAQAMGKETLLIKSKSAKLPSDFVRSEYIEYGDDFEKLLSDYLSGLRQQAEHYEQVADLLERNPILAIDYLRRAYLITGEARLKGLANHLLHAPGLESRARNSVEMLAADF